MSIRDRILARADLDGLRAARDITGLAAALNADAPMEVHQRFVSARAVMSGCADGITILGALKAASADPAIGWALQFLGQEAGLDVGDPFTQIMIGELVAGGVLTASQGESLKALARRPLHVTQEQVATEMYHPDGTEK